MKPTLFIIGGSSTALEIYETVTRFDSNKYCEIFNVISDVEEVTSFNIIRDSFLLDKLKSTANIKFILGFTNYNLRQYFYKTFYMFGGELVNVIHPSSYISSSAIVGTGNYIAANVVISSNALLGNSNLINYNVTIGHDVVVGSDCFFNPGARISGNVKIGSDCLFGANSFIFQGLEIGNNCQIDALSYVDRKIESNCICSSNSGNLRIYKKRF